MATGLCVLRKTSKTQKLKQSNMVSFSVSQLLRTLHYLSWHRQMSNSLVILWVVHILKYQHEQNFLPWRKKKTNLTQILINLNVNATLSWYRMHCVSLNTSSEQIKDTLMVKIPPTLVCCLSQWALVLLSRLRLRSRSHKIQQWTVKTHKVVSGSSWSIGRYNWGAASD